MLLTYNQLVARNGRRLAPRKAKERKASFRKVGLSEKRLAEIINGEPLTPTEEHQKLPVLAALCYRTRIMPEHDVFLQTVASKEVWQKAWELADVLIEKFDLSLRWYELGVTDDALDRLKQANHESGYWALTLDATVRSLDPEDAGKRAEEKVNAFLAQFRRDVQPVVMIYMAQDAVRPITDGLVNCRIEIKRRLEIAEYWSESAVQFVEENEDAFEANLDAIRYFALNARAWAATSKAQFSGACADAKEAIERERQAAHAADAWGEETLVGEALSNIATIVEKTAHGMSQAKELLSEFDLRPNKEGYTMLKQRHPNILQRLLVKAACLALAIGGLMAMPADADAGRSGLASLNVPIPTPESQEEVKQPATVIPDPDEDPTTASF